jgi:hypothetical protein
MVFAPLPTKGADYFRQAKILQGRSHAGFLRSVFRYLILTAENDLLMDMY